jgi:tellurite resistance protein TerC
MWHASPWLWVGFNLFVLLMLALDLGIFHRKAHEVRTKEAAIWSAVWIALALAFGAGLYALAGPRAGLEFLTGYLLEKALSVDNLFVFVLIFGYFGIPRKDQHRVLFWGILGALLMRGAMIGAGAVLVQRFHWILYLFGAFLVITGIRMAVQGEEEIDPEANPVLRLVRRFLPVTTGYEGDRFFVQRPTGRKGEHRWLATPLFVVLILVETSDLIFAVDSIPAVFAVTRDPFLVYTSNIFAILGLRSLYFLLAGLISRLHYLKYGLAAVLAFVGVKMLLVDLFPIPIGVSLGTITALLATATLASLRAPEPHGAEAEGKKEPHAAVPPVGPGA